MNEKISIIIPIYNAEKYLETCLESVINQTYTDLEIILIDDGSKDKTNSICVRYQKLDNRIIYIKQDNNGVSSARNKGLEISKGDYVLFVDSDDYLELNMIEKLYSNLKKYDCDISICNYFIIENYLKNENKTMKLYNNILNKDEFIKYMLNNEYYKGYLWNKLIKRKIINEVRFKCDIHVMEDIVFLLNISENIKKVHFDEKLFLYNYIQNPKSVLHNFSAKHFSAILSYEIILSYIERNSTQIIKEDYYFYIWNYIFIFMNQYYYLFKEKLITHEVKNKRNHIKKYYLKKALLRKKKLSEKLKLILITYFPISWGKLKGFIRSVK